MAREAPLIDPKDLLRTLITLMGSPSDPLLLLRTAVALHRVKRRETLAKLVTWFTVAAPQMGAQTSRVLDVNSGLISRLFAACDTDAITSTALRRLCVAAPTSATFWDLEGIWRRKDNDAEEATCLIRALILDCGGARRWSGYAHNQVKLGSTDKMDIAALFDRAIILDPLGTDTYRRSIGLDLFELSVDKQASQRLANKLKRWILTDPQIERWAKEVKVAFRRIGDWHGMRAVSDWFDILLAQPGNDGPARGSRAAIDRFDDEIRSLAPYTIDVDFEARVFGTRVLLHPRLPDAGPWVLHGPDEHVDRAFRVLSYANPDATILRPADDGAEEARVLSLVPSDAPDCWYLPCLWGHWHVWWSVMPAVLDANGRPSLDQVLNYSVRTRQFVTFWYAKGHERAYIDAHRSLGSSIAERMSDAASRESYLQTLSADRPTYIRRFFTETAHRLQYFDYAVYRPGDVILNLGVAEGFEVPAYLALIAPSGVLHNIDPEGHSTLGEPARAWIEGTSCQIHFHELALSDVDGDVEMETGGCWEDARVSKRQLGQIKTLPSKRLDSFIAEERIDRIDHIKLDIEGGEGFLLDQLIAVMHSHRPQIEISIYHTIEQFFEIPDRMMREAKGYRFFFHHYCGHFGEGTLYAIPEEIEPLLPIKP